MRFFWIVIVFFSPAAAGVIVVAICLFSLVMGWRSSLASDTEPDNYSAECSSVAQLLWPIQRDAYANQIVAQIWQPKIVFKVGKWNGCGNILGSQMDGASRSHAAGGPGGASHGAASSVCTSRRRLCGICLPLLRHRPPSEVEPERRAEEAACKRHFCDLV